MTKQNHEKLAFWREQLARLKASGMSQAEYCHAHDLKRFQFYYWHKNVIVTRESE